MTKKYFCDFCGVRIQNNVQIRKKHNEGLVHQEQQANHYRQFKSAEEILKEERQKTICTRFLSNRCNFGSICRFSHYSRHEIEGLQHEGKI